MNIKIKASERTSAAKAIGEAIETRPVYMRAPSFAYQIGGFTLGRDGELTWDGSIDQETLHKALRALTAAGIDHSEEYEGTGLETAPEPAGRATDDSIEVSLPTTNHTGRSLKNLVNLIYTRAGLINKATGAGFAVDRGLIDALAEDDGINTAEDFRKAVDAYKADHKDALCGIEITAEKVTFCMAPSPEILTPEKIRAFMALACAMNQQAIRQKRIQAKTVNEENEKYAMRIWLIRLGMNGPENKEERRTLLQNLSGHTAFRTEEEKQRWTERHTTKEGKKA